MQKYPGMIQGYRHRLELVKFGSFQIAILILYLLKIIIDPLNLEDDSERVIADFYNSTFAPFYGTPISRSESSPEVRSGQNEIVVVLIDQDTMEGNTWPLVIPFYRALLDSLAKAGSAAVFVDIYFQPGDSVRDAQIADLFVLADEIEREAGMPTIFGSLLDDPLPEYRGKQAGHYALVEMNSIAQTYFLVQPTSEGRMKAAAYSLYLEWCKRKVCANPISSSDENHQMFVRWGAGPDSLNVAAFGLQSCAIRSGTVEQIGSEPDTAAVEDRPRGFLRQVTDSGKLLYSRFFTMNRQIDNPASCVYHRKLSADELLYSMERAEVAQWLNGKIVLIGADVELYKDTTRSPVHGDIPGVFKIAMALDNLLEMGNSYQRWVPEKTSIKVEAVLFAFVTAIYIFFHGWSRASSTDVERDQLNVLFGAGVLLALMLVVITSFQVFHWGPNTWVNFLLMYLLVCAPSIYAVYRYGTHLFSLSPSRYGILNVLLKESLAFVYLTFMLLGGALLVILPIAILSGGVGGADTILFLFYVVYAVALILVVSVMRRIKNEGKARRRRFNFLGYRET